MPGCYAGESVCRLGIPGIADGNHQGPLLGVYRLSSTYLHTLINDLVTPEGRRLSSAD